MMWLLAQIESALLKSGFNRESDSRMRFSKTDHPLRVSIEEHRYQGWQKERGTTVKFSVSLFNPAGDGPLIWPVVMTAWFQGDHIASGRTPDVDLITTPENRAELAKQFIEIGLRWVGETLSIDLVAKEIARRIEQRRELVQSYRHPLRRLLLVGHPRPREARYDYFCASLAAWHLGDPMKALAHAENYATAIGDSESHKWVSFLQEHIQGTTPMRRDESS